MRLIDAMKTVTNLSGRITPLIKMGENPIRVYDEVLQVIADAPTVDATVVVRCKDCNHSKLPSMVTQRYGVPGTLTCHNPKSPCNRRNVNQDGFCPFGERRTD